MMNQNLARFQESIVAGIQRTAFVKAVVVKDVRVWRFALCLALFAALLPLQSAQAQQRVYVPMIAVTQRNVIGSGEAPKPCDLSAKEAAAAKLIAESGDQRRDVMVCHGTLAEVARARAKDMAERAYFSHTNPDGIGPNLLIEQAGYDLPSWYSSKRDANNVESIAAGFATAEDVVKGWRGSDGHRRHILGLIDFYADQEIYGIGYYYKAGSPYGHYWVFLSAHPEGIETTGTPATLSETMP